LEQRKSDRAVDPVIAGDEVIEEANPLITEGADKPEGKARDREKTESRATM